MGKNVPAEMGDIWSSSSVLGRRYAVCSPPSLPAEVGTVPPISLDPGPVVL